MAEYPINVSKKDMRALFIGIGAAALVMSVFATYIYLSQKHSIDMLFVLLILLSLLFAWLLVAGVFFVPNTISINKDHILLKRLIGIKTVNYESTDIRGIGITEMAAFTDGRKNIFISKKKMQERILILTFNRFRSKNGIITKERFKIPWFSMITIKESKAEYDLEAIKDFLVTDHGLK